MRVLDRATAEELLGRQGVGPRSEVEKVLSGFDLTKPLYEHDFWPHDKLFQLVRLPSALDPLPTSGNWFGLAGITTSGVAINDGLAGRHLVGFEVAAPFKALEGTAARFKPDLGRALGGVGGATQVFIPRSLLGHIHSTGPANRQ